jgi:hypothetical protein
MKDINESPIISFEQFGCSHETCYKHAIRGHPNFAVFNPWLLIMQCGGDA